MNDCRKLALEEMWTKLANVAETAGEPKDAPLSREMMIAHFLTIYCSPQGDELQSMSANVPVSLSRFPLMKFFIYLLLWVPIGIQKKFKKNQILTVYADPYFVVKICSEISTLQLTRTVFHQFCIAT
jgi:hypothetical protein